MKCGVCGLKVVGLKYSWREVIMCSVCYGKTLMEWPELVRRMRKEARKYNFIVALTGERTIAISAGNYTVAHMSRRHNSILIVFHFIDTLAYKKEIPKDVRERILAFRNDITSLEWSYHPEHGIGWRQPKKVYWHYECVEISIGREYPLWEAPVV